VVRRLETCQPDYPPVQNLKQRRGQRSRKRAAVAAARWLAIDLWRIQTGQCPAQELGFDGAQALAQILKLCPRPEGEPLGPR
jgi:hypothetical protein